MTGVLNLLQHWLSVVLDASARVPGWAATMGGASWPLAVLAGLLGLALLVAGVRLGRALTAAGGALVGWVAAGSLGGLAAGVVPATALAWGGAAVLGFASALAPAVYPLALGIIPGALLGSQVPLDGRGWVGAAAGALLLGLLALVTRRVVVAGTAAVAGAVLVGAALLALGGRIPALAALAQRPLLLAGACAVLAVAGTAYQIEVLGRRRAPADRDAIG